MRGIARMVHAVGMCLRPLKNPQFFCDGVFVILVVTRNPTKVKIYGTYK